MSHLFCALKNYSQTFFVLFFRDEMCKQNPTFLCGCCSCVRWKCCNAEWISSAAQHYIAVILNSTWQWYPAVLNLSSDF